MRKETRRGTQELTDDKRSIVKAVRVMGTLKRVQNQILHLLRSASLELGWNLNLP
jgi:hypothetical protein